VLFLRSSFGFTYRPLYVQTFVPPAVPFLAEFMRLIRRCLPDVDDPECPQCAKENATIRDLRRQQDEWAERQDLFRAHLRDSDDKFGVVANWFGKGVMNSIKLVDT